MNSLNRTTELTALTTKIYMFSGASKASFGWNVLFGNYFSVHGQEYTVLVNTSHDMIQWSVVEVEIGGVTVVAGVVAIVRVVNATVFLLGVHDAVPSGAGIVGGSQAEV